MTNKIIPSHEIIKIDSLDDYYLLQLLLIEKEFKKKLNLNPNSAHIFVDKTKISESPLKNLSKNKLVYKQETKKRIPNDKSNQYETEKKPVKMDFDTNNYQTEKINIAKQLSTSASNRKNIKANTKQASNEFFVDSDNKFEKVDIFDNNLSMNKLEIRNSIRNIDRLFEDNLNYFNIDDFNQMRISYSNQNNNMNRNNSAIGELSKSTIKKKEPMTNEYFLLIII